MPTLDLTMVEAHIDRLPQFNPEDVWDFKLVRWSGNPLFLARSNSSEQFLIKMCDNPRGVVPDICEREYFCSLLGQGFGLPVVRSWATNTPPKLRAIVEGMRNAPRNLILEKCVVMEFLNGSDLESKRRTDSQSVDEAIRLQARTIESFLAFAYWLGDEDRGLKDVMMVNGELVFIDFGLSGPGRHQGRRGAHPVDRYYREIDPIRMCICEKWSFAGLVIEEVKASLAAQPDIIDHIEAIDQTALRSVVKRSGLNDWISDDLCERVTTLRRDFADWHSKAHQSCPFPPQKR